MNTQKGFVLITMLLLLVVLASMASIYFVVSNVEVKSAAADSDSTTGFYAAEGGLNQATENIQEIFRDFRRPQASDLGVDTITLANRSVVTETTKLDDEGDFTVITDPENPLVGLSSINERYDINAKAFGPKGDMESELEMRLTTMEVPIFQFMAIHEKLLELHPGPSMSIEGRVHSNEGVYLDTHNELKVDGQVTAFGEIRRGTRNQCRRGEVEIRDAFGEFEDYGSPRRCKTFEQEDLDKFGGTVRYLEEPLALPPVEDLGVGGLYWNRAELRLKLTQGETVDLYAVAGRSKPRFVAGRVTDNEVTIRAPKVEVVNPNGATNNPATRKLYRQMIDNPGMITVTVPRRGRDVAGRESPGASTSPERGPDIYTGAGYDDVISPLCDAYWAEPLPWNGPRERRARGRGLTYPNGWSVDNPPYRLDPEFLWQFFSNPSTPNNLVGFCASAVARGEMHHYRQNRDMLLLNIDLERLFAAQSGSDAFFDPSVVGENLGLVIYATVDGPHKDPLSGRGNNYGIRLFNGADLSSVAGFSFITDQAAYVQGDFNCRALATPAQLSSLPDGRVDTGNLSGSGHPFLRGERVNRCHPRVSSGGAPLTDDEIQDDGLKRGVAVMADSVNIMSDAWRDENSREQLGGRRPSMTQVNAAILAGSSPSNEGGLHNFPRLLEHWQYNGVGGNSIRLRYRGSMASLGYPTKVDGSWRRTVSPGQGGCCAINYAPPNRDWNFDRDFTVAENLPPLTPRATSVYQEEFRRIY